MVNVPESVREKHEKERRVREKRKHLKKIEEMQGQSGWDCEARLCHCR